MLNRFCQRTSLLSLALAAAVALFAFAGSASAYVPDDRWSTTASG